LLLTSHFFALIIFFHLYRINQSYYITLISWIDCGLFYVNWSLIYDPLSISMLTMVSFIASMVIIYSGSYMDTDPFFSEIFKLFGPIYIFNVYFNNKW
jgi:NADH-quinone oxidoreductase subunit L